MFLFLLVLIISISTGEIIYNDISNFLLTGWWSDFEGWNCTGDYVAAENPKPLDGTGQTCYINPNKQFDVMPGVVWFSKIPNLTDATLASQYDGIYSYYVMFTRYGNRSLFYPGPCDDAGVCECGNFDKVRAGWNETSNEPLDFCFANNFQGGSVLACDVTRPVLKNENCNIYTIRNVTSPTTGDLGRFAALMARLQDTGSYAPTQVPLPENDSSNSDSDSNNTGSDNIESTSTGGKTTSATAVPILAKSLSFLAILVFFSLS